LKIVFRHILFYLFFNAFWALTSGGFRIISDTLVGTDKVTQSIPGYYTSNKSVVVNLSKTVHVSRQKPNTVQFFIGLWYLLIYLLRKNAARCVSFVSKWATFYHTNSICFTDQKHDLWFYCKLTQCMDTRVYGVNDVMAD